ncbi:hypothetical protein DNU06_12140 [Putridiphycobacter roseus]|uniref:Secretion system C-terminal sorting domain-containing protein n=1 Tax=Putridiphycobacter roseus TaxID=2219161 RepID=A0A2W1MXP4_9FLAO|nr:T9SS type A sorting domain-containing protein [Putridiphycobacter roseus]PZE16597.1 hypothetical protein DNU06_12140 [Putridiphycobacter roseus]
MKTLVFTISIICTTLAIAQQNVNIPDYAFKQYLLTNTNINTNADTEISVNEAAVYTGYLNMNGAAISNFTGLEAFTNIVGFNNTGNTAVSTLDISGCFNLAYFDCSGSVGLTTLTMGGHHQLSTIDASNCQISTLSLPQNNVVTYIDVSGNNISSIITQNYPLLTTLDVSDNPSLTNLTIFPNAALNLNISETNFTGLNFSSFPNFTHISVSNCPNLESLNVANGSNTSLIFEATNNPNLTCIEVDDAAYSTTNWNNVDATASFSENCSASTSGLSKNNTASLSLYPNPSNGIVNLISSETIEAVHIFNLAGAEVLEFNQTNQMDISELTQGIYTAVVKTQDGNVSTKKLVKN